MDFAVESRPKTTWKAAFGDMKSLQINKEDVSVCSKLRRLIRGSVVVSDDNWGFV